MPEPSVILFDLDGVLVSPGGYRKAVLETIQRVCKTKISVSYNLPTEQDLQFLEAHGITGEWDMIPLCLAAIIDHDDAANRNALIGQTPKEVCVNYQQIFRRLTRYFGNGVPILENIYQAIQNGEDPELFPNFRKMKLLGETFCNSRRVDKHQVTQIFQTLVMGSNLFSEVYGFKPPFETISFLKQYDRPNITNNTVQLLRQRQESQDWHICAMTARPSSPPVPMRVVEAGYSPEAESALSTAGLADLPKIGYGDLLYVEQQTGFPAEKLMKPDPFQALAAVMTAFGMEPQIALRRAMLMRFPDRKIYWKDDINLEDCSPFFLNQCSIKIFEDSPIGIQAVQAAAQILADQNAQISVDAYGIASDSMKTTALSKVGAKIFCDVNQAIQAASQ